jgi:polyisoprenyl-phosphate glycosyltransferase
MLSLIIPLYNEEMLVDKLLDRSSAALQTVTDDYEIICVDDGSTDRTLEKLLACHKRDSRIKALVLSRNFGHQSAYTAGLTYARGDCIAMMDGDLQDPPELLPAMFEKLTADSFDVVFGRRIEREEKWPKRQLIELFHWIFQRLLSNQDVENTGNFAVFSKRVAQALLSLHEKNRYLPGLRLFVGFKQGYIEYRRPDRHDGAAKMNLAKLIQLAFDAFFSFTDLPLKICLYTGILGVITFFFALFFTFTAKALGVVPYIGWSSTVLSIFFFGSVQLVFMGILGEYVYRIYRETQNRPIFIVREYIE